MKVLLEIKESKKEFVLELLDSLNFVTVRNVPEEKVKLKNNLRKAVEELNLVRLQKLKGISAQELLDEL